MSQPQVAPYGSWKSPITSELIAAGTVGLMEPMVDGDDIYWLEMRPAEGGRYVVVRRTPDGRTADITPPDFNARTRVHEYGGGPYLVHAGTVYFSNFKDQRLYEQRAGHAPRPLTPEAAFRYADAVIDVKRNRLICVREDHAASSREAVNTICAVDLAGGTGGRVLASGSDFYAAPRLSPDGSRLAWVEWDHPNMPWDSTRLCVAAVRGDGSLGAPTCVVGAPGESVGQPLWSPDGTLYFVSDRTGWWNLYRRRGDSATIEPVCPMEAEFGLADWVFRRPTYGFADARTIVCAFTQRGSWQLARIDAPTGRLERLGTPCTQVAYVVARPGEAIFCGAAPTQSPAVMRLDLATLRTETLRPSASITFDPGYLSVPQAVEFPTEGGLTAHAFFYPPRNRDFTAPPGERPPLLVISHGGPTSATAPALSLGIQYWTSRGLAVADVNYGGSTGYGRAYRERLRGAWGVVDVDDCVNAAKHLAARGDADPERLAIRGGSAGGYTTLCALTFRDVFRAGASHFGISDAEALARETHKFESRYLDGLIGPYPERRDLYIQRSPIHHVDRLSCPLILFQGLDDKIVLPNQAEMMFDAVRRKGIPVAYVPFEGEQHGFRKAENIRRALDGELYFYSRVFGFALAEPVEPVRIENLTRPH